jgi:predicted nuclease of predicted toxin-antitoxin system
VRFLVDENLSPRLAAVFNELGYDATSVRDRGRLGMSDAAVLAWAVEEDRVIVTANGDDFRELIGQVDLHPGLWILPSAATNPASKLLRKAAAFACAQDEVAAAYMVTACSSRPPPATSAPR